MDLPITPADTCTGGERSAFDPLGQIVGLVQDSHQNKLLSAGSSERNRIQKVLEDANIKLGSVLSDVFGVSGQKMLQQLVKKDTVDIANVMQLVGCLI